MLHVIYQDFFFTFISYLEAATGRDEELRIELEADLDSTLTLSAARFDFLHVWLPDWMELSLSKKANS